jgi:hypothetical protein
MFAGAEIMGSIPTERPIRKTFSGGKTRRREGVERYPCGQVKHADRRPEETPEEIQSVVVAYRAKQGLPTTSSEHAESPFGILHLQGVITKRQYRAGCRVAAIWDDYAYMNGFPRKWPKPLDLEGSMSRGASFDPFDLDTAWSPDEYKARQEKIDRIKRDNADISRLLTDIEQSASCRGVANTLRNAILYRIDISHNDHQIGNLRSGLNVVARFLGIE